MAQTWIASLTTDELAALRYDWTFWGRDEQQMPPGDWRYCLWLAGRGWGKTRTGGEGVLRLKEMGYNRMALVAPTAADARDVMVEGESGILAISPPWDRPLYEPSKRRLTWPNGAIATLYSAEDPDALRGPQFDAAWCDELAAWHRLQSTWDMLQFGMRLGSAPRCLVTTTPRPLKLVKELASRSDVIIIRGKTLDNRDNLATPFIDSIIKRYEGTRLGRQELDAEILDDNPDALWQRENFEQNRKWGQTPDLRRIVVAIDPPASSRDGADEAGIVAAGLGKDDRAYVLADRSMRGLRPHEWAGRAVKLYHDLKADRIVAEVNQGGEMVEAVLRQVDPTVAFKAISASRGKVLRAEPISALYAQHRVSHVGVHPQLEDQMAEFTTDFDRGTMGYSPDRVDALVHALTDLMLVQRPMVISDAVLARAAAPQIFRRG